MHVAVLHLYKTFQILYPCAYIAEIVWGALCKCQCTETHVDFKVIKCREALKQFLWLVLC